MSTKNSLDPFSVTDQRIVVVGGTAGIGLSAAHHLANAGARVIITGRRQDGTEIAASIGALFVQMDVSQPGSVNDGFTKIASLLGTVDCLLLNAGMNQDHGTISELDFEAFEQVLQTNTLGLVRAMAAATPLLADEGSVIVTSSPAGTITMAGMSAYSASKAALDILVRTWAIELAGRKIRVNAVLPGIVESELTSDRSSGREIIQAVTVAGVFRDPDDLAPVFQFLASRASVTLTGSKLSADDGMTAGYSNSVIESIALRYS